MRNIQVGDALSMRVADTGEYDGKLAGECVVIVPYTGVLGEQRISVMQGSLAPFFILDRKGHHKEDGWHSESTQKGGLMYILSEDGIQKMMSHHVLDKEELHTGTMLTNDEPVYIGASQFWDPRFFDGLMDDAALFNVALTQDDIEHLMTVGLSSMLAVSSEGKLIATWAQLKRQFVIRDR